MTIQGELLFSGEALADLVLRREKVMAQRIAEIKSQEIDEATLDNKVEALVREFELKAPKLREEEIKVEENTVKPMADSVGTALLGGDNQENAVVQKVMVPFDRDAEFFSCTPAIGLSSTPPRGLVESGTLSLFYTVRTGEEARVLSARKNDLTGIKKILNRLQREAEEYNAGLGKKIRDQLKPAPEGEKKKA